MAKFCKKCYKLLELTNFYKTKNTKTYIDGHIDWCKECLKLYRKSKKNDLESRSQQPSFFIEKKTIVVSFD